LPTQHPPLSLHDALPIFEPTTPSAPAKEASRHFLVGRSISLCFALSGSRFAPSLAREGSFARPKIPSNTHQNDLLLNAISFHLSDRKSTRLNSSHLGISY